MKQLKALKHNCNYLKIRTKKTQSFTSRVGDFHGNTVYQIDKNGIIIKPWYNVREICEYFVLHDNTVYSMIKNQILLENTLFVFMNDYKSSFDYGKLVKYLRYKKQVLTSPNVTAERVKNVMFY